VIQTESNPRAFLEMLQKLTLVSLSTWFLFVPGLSAQQITLRLIDGDGSAVAGTVMELLSESVLDSTSMGMREAQIDQLDKEFVPTVTTIVAGGNASFPNSDDILHHVYSFSPAKTFDTPLYGSDADSQYHETFDVPGVVEIGCNIHDWMLAYIYVGQSDLMAISDGQGIATLTGIPPGEYTLKVWHSRLDAPQNSLQQVVLIEAGGTKEIDMTLQLVRDRRVRRAPSASRKRYR